MTRRDHLRLAITPSEVRRALLLREEIALLDVRHEAAFATGHPLFAANMAADRIELEAALRLPRKDVPTVLYDGGEGLIAPAAERLASHTEPPAQLICKHACKFPLRTFPRRCLADPSRMCYGCGY